MTPDLLADRTTRRPAIALAVTLAGQALASLCLSAAGVLAPAVAPMIGHAPESVGIFIGVGYFAAMLSGLQGGRGVARFGAVGLTQVALVCIMAAMAAVTLAAGPPFGHGLFLLAVAALIGVGYGVLNPTATLLLHRHTPPGHRALFFSIKQAGVPVGVALAGVMMPAALAWRSWQAACWIAAGLCLAAAVAMAFARRPLEPERFGPGGRTGGETAVVRGTGLARVLQSPELRVVVLASFAFAVAQLSFVTFLVSYLNLGLGHGLGVAAGVLAISQVISTGARVGWGAVADRWIAPGRLLGLLGIGAGITLALLGAAGSLPGGVGPGLATALGVATAVTAMSWNGVYIAALAQRSRPGELASVTGASQFITFSGSTIGPMVFGGLVQLGLSYGAAYLLIALLPLAAGVAMVVSERKTAVRPR